MASGRCRYPPHRARTPTGPSAQPPASPARSSGRLGQRRWLWRPRARRGSRRPARSFQPARPSGLFRRCPGYHIRGKCSWLPRPAIVICQPHDVVFAEIVAALHLDDVQWHRARVLQTVRRSLRNARALVDVEIEDTLAAGDPRGAGRDNPVLAAPMVVLERQAPARLDRHALDLVLRSLLQHRVAAPGPMDRLVDQVLRGLLLA